MKIARTSIIVIAVMAALTVVGRADDKDKAATEAFVQFGELVTPAPAAGSLAGTLTHFLLPDDVTIRKDGSVSFGTLPDDVTIRNDGSTKARPTRVAPRTPWAK